jgi:aryl-alcohol dehydrogenase-like predicted oxidoreductase
MNESSTSEPTTAQVRMGNSGLEVSSVILGCMGFGEPQRGNHPWSVGLDGSRELFRRAFELGITTFDTANVYSAGSSEEIVGQLIREVTPREDVIIATKVYGRMRPGPHGAGLSRTSILREVDDSLRRLGTDYIDLYQIHRFDRTVPIEETMTALHDVVKAGKVRYIGASSMYAWQFAKMQHVAELGGLTKFVAMQDQYNLIAREHEREMHPFCLDQGVGVIPWSPLARGKLTRPWEGQTARSETDHFGQQLYRQAEESDRLIVEAVARVAEARGVSRAQVALAWVAQQAAVTAPIVGATKVSHIEDAVAAVTLELTPEEIATLEEHYVPHAIEDFFF